MGLRVRKRSGPAIPPMDAGTYAAVCVGVVDLGEQYSETFKKYSDKVLLIWEIPSQTVEVDGEQKPRWLSKDFAQSLNEKSNLYKFLLPWRGREFTQEELDGGYDLRELLGTGCLLSVTVGERDDGSKFNKIAAVIGLPEGLPAPSTQTERIAFDLDAWDDAAFAALPEWVQDRIKKSTQYQKQHAPEDALSLKGEATEAAEEECPI